jgi:dTDP-4-amino-4,6-dideoxygalactose transaminase
MYGIMALPCMEVYFAQALSLPMFPTLTEPGQEFVIQSIHEFFGDAE